MEFDPIFENVTISNVIPSFSTVTEDALYTIASVEESYTNIMKEIGIYELSLVMEEGDAAADTEKKEKKDIKAILNKFLEFVKGLWGKITELVKSAIDKVEYMIVQKTKAINDVMKISPNQLVDAVKKLSTDNPEKFAKQFGKGSLGKRIKYNDSFANAALKNIASSNEAVLAIVEKINKDAKAEDFKDTDIAKIVADKMSTGSKVSITEEDIKNIGKFKDKLAEALLEYQDVKYDESTILPYIKEAYNVVSSSKKDFKDNIKKPYVDAKKAFDKAVKTAKKANHSKEFKPLFKSAATASKLYAAIIGAIETSYIRYSAWSFRLVLKATMVAKSQSQKGKKEEKQEVVNNSAMIESSTFQTELQSLFTFN